MTHRFTSNDELIHRAAYHPPRAQDTIDAHERVRELITELALELNSILPEGREKSMALSFADQTMWAANAAVARGHAKRDAEALAITP